MNLATMVVAGMVAIVFITIVVIAIGNKKNGKGACACGGDCSSCSHCHR